MSGETNKIELSGQEGKEGRRKEEWVRLGVGSCETFQLVIPIMSLVSRDCFIPFIGKFKVGWVGLLVCNSMWAQLCGCLVSLQCSSGVFSVFCRLPLMCHQQATIGRPIQRTQCSCFFPLLRGEATSQGDNNLESGATRPRSPRIIFRLYKPF